MEVIYLGPRQTPLMIVKAAIQEDVDVIALSILSGAHMTIFPKIIDLLEKENISDILITGGGIIPETDVKILQNHSKSIKNNIKARQNHSKPRKNTSKSLKIM